MGSCNPSSECISIGQIRESSCRWAPGAGGQVHEDGITQLVKRVGADAGERAVLLATKLHVPDIGGQLVHRASLLEALLVGRRRKLTLLSAPAGWGKTTLLAQWVVGAGEDQRFGWLSLDRSDNDPVWFWMYVIAALQKVSPGVGTRAFELLGMGADPLRVVLPNLLNQLASIEHQMVLILDDYHLVASRAVHEQLTFVINRMPRNLHLVLATRSDPLLPLARLRADGDLLEVRTEDLRFRAMETDRLLNDVLGLDVGRRGNPTPVPTHRGVGCRPVFGRPLACGAY